MLKKLISLGVVAGVASLAVLDANPATAASLSFNVIRHNDSSIWGSGDFEGTDDDSDGLLKLGELTSFTFNDIHGYYSLNLDDLFDLGSFDLNNGVWNADASGWGSPTGSYFSWAEGIAVDSSWASMAYDYQPEPQTPATVPEPGTVAALALMGVSGLLTKRKLSKCSA
ncbi:PEP-CTERM sorting domain-containing protein [Laspinema sp. D1]|uniref:PEP-CTERM sorting domain-containing protein n=1 Tax=Laspinema palackyanum D2a TaxID=2953684 RepID=A0ABT2MV85_9CYAN|nr:PEP-CTERM sorting domain-containing protein [Laspinema sp. D2a]